MPEMGKHVEAGKPFMVVESVKSVSDVFSGVTGEIVAINHEVATNPALVNTDPYGKGWFVKIKPKDMHELSGLMSAEQYKQFARESGH